MLPKANRLKKKKDFETIFKKGKRFKEDFLLFKVVKKNSETKRFGFVINQKVSKKATIRNKLRRKLSRLTELKLKQIKKGIDGIFVVIPGLENKDYWELEEIIDKILNKAGVLKQKND